MAGFETGNNFEAKDNILQATNPDKVATALGTTTNELQSSLDEYSKNYPDQRNKEKLARFLNDCDAVDLRSRLNITSIKDAPIVANVAEKTSKGGGLFQQAMNAFKNHSEELRKY